MRKLDYLILTLLMVALTALILFPVADAVAGAMNDASERIQKA